MTVTNPDPVLSYPPCGYTCAPSSSTTREKMFAIVIGVNDVLHCTGYEVQSLDCPMWTRPEQSGGVEWSQFC